MSMTIAQIWRYPVKSMQGELLDHSAVLPGGIPNDRGWAVRDEASGTIRGAKYLGGLLQCSARYLPGTSAGPVPHAEITLPDGRTVNTDDPAAASAVSEVLARAVTLWPLQPAEDAEHYRVKGHEHADMESHLRTIFALLPDEPLPDLSVWPADLLAELTTYAAPRGTYFDAVPLHVLTDASMSALAAALPDTAIDVRRFRPNLVIHVDGDAPGPVEQAWVGRTLAAGSVRIAAELPCPRCVMTTREQGDLERAPQIMRTLVRAFRQNLGVYGRATTGGPLEVGTPVEVL